MQAFQASIGKRLLQQRKGGSCSGTTCGSPSTSLRSNVTELHVARCALPAASASACAPADLHYVVPSSITTKAEFEHQYLQHMVTPNRYCRYGDIELYAPSEEGAAAILKTVAEPLIRCQRWLRLGNSLMHIFLYELLKIFAALGGDRELILAGSEELNALATLKSGSGHLHMSFHVEPDVQTPMAGLNSETSTGNGICNGSHVTQSHPNVIGHCGAYTAAASIGNGLLATASNGSGCVAISNGNGFAAARNINAAGSLAAANGIGSCGNGSTSNGNGNHMNGNCSSSIHHNKSGCNASGNGTQHPSHAPPPGPGSSSHSSPPTMPGFLLLRTAPGVRDLALGDPTATGLLSALSSGAASPLLLVEMHDSDGSSSRCRNGNSNIAAGGFSAGLVSQDWTRSSKDDEVAAAAGGTLAVTAAKYRLWARMMEAALHTRGSVPVATYRVDSRRNRGHVAAPVDNGNSGDIETDSKGAANVQQARPIVVWGLLTDLKCWRFYCLRETMRQASTYGSNSNGDASSVRKFEILGSRRLRVADEYMTTWPGLVPALAALYAILCTADGLAVQRSGDASQALTYDMPHDPHRDRLMHFHLIMGAPNAPLYGTVGEWVRQRLGEYVRCRHEQKRLRQASESTAHQAARAVAAARAAAAAAAAATINHMPPPLPSMPSPAAAVTAIVANPCSTLRPLPATLSAAGAPASEAAAQPLLPVAAPKSAAAAASTPAAASEAAAAASFPAVVPEAEAAASFPAAASEAEAAASSPAAASEAEAAASSPAAAPEAEAAASSPAVVPEAEAAASSPAAAPEAEAAASFPAVVPEAEAAASTPAAASEAEAAASFPAVVPEAEAAASFPAVVPEAEAAASSPAAASEAEAAASFPAVVPEAEAAASFPAVVPEAEAAASSPTAASEAEAAASSPTAAPEAEAAASFPAAASEAEAAASSPTAAPEAEAAASSPTAAPEAAGSPALTIFVSNRTSEIEREPLSPGYGGQADKKGTDGQVGAAATAMAAATGTTEYYEVRLAVARQQLAEARERASRLRLHARALGVIPQPTPVADPSEARS
ncbi:hypothetical protein Vafri_13142 [Volvox africanus]|uniref:Uncharacterized protein n=1 Tax=Volvox africanus TaxID=51714 RepID=A0A8J4BBF2_9CHLO|nr:hypothetical protein Vafri_13142 [Volvox africanus]